jgi:5-methylcytosine-specific restriction endonuclease McrA
MRLQILEVMKQHPDGITEGEMRAILKVPAEEQTNFGRRRRELGSAHHIEKRRDGARILYVYKGPREKGKDAAAISQKLRAQVLHYAKGRCGMCGRDIAKHDISLVVDHKLPRDMGGSTEPENLWALCEECNSGKKNFFSSVNVAGMKVALPHKSIHMRLGEMLKASMGVPVPDYIMEFVGNQGDWQKRTRELRYLGWEFKTFNKRLQDGRVCSFYVLTEWKRWPDDPTAVIRQFEQDRARRNRQGDSEEDDSEIG